MERLECVDKMVRRTGCSECLSFLLEFLRIDISCQEISLTKSIANIYFEELKLTLLFMEKVGAKTNFLFAKDYPASLSKEKPMVIEFA